MRLRINYLPNYNMAWGELKKAHEADAGIDLRAASDVTIALTPGSFAVIPLGISTEFDAGYEAQIRARSGLAAKHGIGLVNGVGTVDSGYRGEWAVVLYNYGKETFIIEPGDRICQVVFNQLPEVVIDSGDIDYSDDRGGGFGSTGVA